MAPTKKKWNMKVKMSDRDVSEIPVEKGSSRWTEYRKKVKENNPEKYKTYLMKDKERKKLDRDALKGDSSRAAKLKKKISNENARLRMKKYREKKKNESKEVENTDSTVTISPVPLTTSTPDSTLLQKDRSKYFREYRQKKRAEMSRQKKTALRKLDKERKTPKKVEPNIHQVNIKEKDVPARVTRYHKRKAENVLPQTPNKYAKVISALVESATPRRAAALASHGIGKRRKQNKLSQALEKSVSELVRVANRKGTTKESYIVRNAMQRTIGSVLRKYRVLSYGSHILGFRKKTLIAKSREKAPDRFMGFMRKKRIDRISDDKKKALSLFFESDEISQPRPEKKFKGKRLMRMSLHKAYSIYKGENDKAMGFTRFCALRPANVLLLSRSHRFGCQCPYCLNLEMKLDSVNKQLSSHKMKSPKCLELYNLLDVIMCHRKNESKYHSPECIQRKCLSCLDTLKRLQDYYHEAIPIFSEKGVVFRWQRWENVLQTIQKRVEGKFVKVQKIRRILVGKHGNFETLLNELVSDIEKPAKGGPSFTWHLFSANWQSAQLKKLKDTLPLGTVLMILDFGENFTTLFQDEIKSAHFAKCQITIHPVIVYYRDQETKRLIMESLVMLSDDITHDHHAVQEFRNRAIGSLQSRNVEIKAVIDFSDGAASQYKSAGCMADISHSEEDFGFPHMRNYFASEHGKGASDGETGLCKTEMELAVLGKRVVIRNADDAYDFCKGNLTSHKMKEISRREFFLVKNIDHTRERTMNKATVSGTRFRIHSVMSSGVNNKVNVRNLSCFCSFCIKGDYDSCTNSGYCNSWTTTQIKEKGQVRKLKKVGIKKEKKIISVGHEKDCILFIWCIIINYHLDFSLVIRLCFNEKYRIAVVSKTSEKIF